MSAGDAVGDVPDGRRDVTVDGGSNVLVLSSSMDDGARRAYYERFLSERPGQLDVLAINYRQTPDEWLDEWRRYVGQTPRRAAIVSVEDTFRSAVAPEGAATVDGNTVVCLEGPADLTGLGIRLGEFLDGYTGGRRVVTFDTLTVLLQYVDLSRAFRFLHVFTNRVKHAGATAHYHMDPEAHDDRAVATVESLFDAVARFDDGSWSVDGREARGAPGGTGSTPR